MTDQPSIRPPGSLSRAGGPEPPEHGKNGTVPIVDLTALVAQLRAEAERCDSQQQRVMQAAWMVHGGLSRQRDLLTQLADLLETGRA